jgi:tryptophan synthase alpha chain
VLCVDLPPEESDELKACTDAQDLDVIFLLSPTSGADRMKRVADRGRGFIYYVSVTGVTGARQAMAKGLRAQVAKVRKVGALPVGVGFGISTPAQAAEIAKFADAAVVGSALVQRIENAKTKGDKATQAGRFIGQLKHAMKRARRRRLH